MRKVNVKLSSESNIIGPKFINQNVSILLKSVINSNDNAESDAGNEADTDDDTKA